MRHYRIAYSTFLFFNTSFEILPLDSRILMRSDENSISFEEKDERVYHFGLNFAILMMYQEQRNIVAGVAGVTGVTGAYTVKEFLFDSIFMFNILQWNSPG